MPARTLADYKRIFSQNLQYQMDIHGKTQVDIINDLGIDRSTISTWCLGKRIPRMDKVEILARYFGIEKSDLIDDKMTPPDEGEDAEVLRLYHSNQDIQNIINSLKTLQSDDLHIVANLISRLGQAENS